MELELPSRPGWHPGEHSIHAKLGYDSIPQAAGLYKFIKLSFPPGHIDFYSSQIQYLPVCILDKDGRPWVSVWTGKEGKTGFIERGRKIDGTERLRVQTKLWNDDPFLEVLKGLREGGREIETMMAAVGIDVTTRTRNKFAGKITTAELSLAESGIVIVEVLATQAIQNCPKYITIRKLAHYPHTSPSTVYNRLQLAPTERLPDEIIDFVLACDSCTLGTVYIPPTQEDEIVHPAHLGANHRGGRKGFVRVKQSDGRTLVVPDYSGDRIMTSLGNIEVTPLAGLTFISFTTGDVLYLTGTARNVHGPEAREIMPLQNVLTEIYVTGYTFVKNAFPARSVKEDGTNLEEEESPYNPPLRYLAEEDAYKNVQMHLLSGHSDDEKVKAKLTGITIHSPSIATFHWESSSSLDVQPGQAVLLDMGPWLGEREYHHIWDVKPSAVNDDFLRTITVSSFAAYNTRKFDVTLKEKQGGAVTGPLFNLARAPWNADLSVEVNVAGITGNFVLPKPTFSSLPEGNKQNHRTKLLWIAGGIGVTPFIAMLKAIIKLKDTQYDVIFSVSTREPHVILGLIKDALDPESEMQTILPHPYVNLELHLFTHPQLLEADHPTAIQYERHPGRIDSHFFEGLIKREGKLKSSEIFVCGPDLFEKSVLQLLGKAGEGMVDIRKVRRETFRY